MTSSQSERASAVAQIFSKLRLDPTAGERIKGMEHVCRASLELAKYPIKHIANAKKPHDNNIPLPDRLLVRKIKNLKVPVITASIPIDPTTEYRNCVWISYFDAQCATAGGINLPKIVKCHGSDGKVYKQLVRTNHII